MIAERWRRVEQVLDPRTKILKIWTAWGAEQAEVSNTDRAFLIAMKWKRKLVSSLTEKKRIDDIKVTVRVINWGML